MDVAPDSWTGTGLPLWSTGEVASVMGSASLTDALPSSPSSPPPWHATVPSAFRAHSETGPAEMAVTFENPLISTGFFWSTIGLPPKAPPSTLVPQHQTSPLVTAQA